MVLASLVSSEAFLSGLQMAPFSLCPHMRHSLPSMPVSVAFVFIYGCAGSSLLSVGILWFQQAGTTLQSYKGFLPWLLIAAFGSRAHGLHYLGHMVLVAPWHVESSQPRDRTPVPCTGRWILDHWTTRRVPHVCLNLCRRAHPHVCAYALSHVWLCDPMAHLSMDFPGKNIGAMYHFLFGDLPDPGLKPTTLDSPALVDEFFNSWATREAHPYDLIYRNFHFKGLFLSSHILEVLGIASLHEFWGPHFWS